MSNVKKYLITSITLGAIALASGLLIAGTNVVTIGPIKAYEKKQFNSGIQKIFGEDASADKEDKKLFNDSNYTYVSGYYEVKDSNEKYIGYLFSAEGSNSYGKIELIVGFSYDSSALIGFTVLKNEQSFASTLNKKYIKQVQNGERELTDVSCGATYGATLIKNMINEAQTARDSLKGE